MIEYLPQAIASLNAAANIVNGLLKLRDFAKQQDAVIEFGRLITDAQSKLMLSQNEQFALAAKVSELEQECMRLKDFEAERKKYTRKEIANGVFAYVVNDFVGKLENAHKYCCNCFDNHKKSTLQQFHVSVGRQFGLSCHNKCPDLIFWYYIDANE